MNFAIISEYNPFHNGHLYQISEIKNNHNCDNIIVIQSGNFVQRGDVSIASKFTRAKMALSQGADLVLELPQIYSTSSANFFAKGAVSSLNSLNIIDNLCFGTENASAHTLDHVSQVLIDEPNDYKNTLKSNLSMGYSFPKSRAMALEQYGYSDIISTPNNILGIEYIKALKELNSSIFPITINRTNDFHEETITNNISSATAIRKNISNLSLVSKAIPPNAFEIFKEDITINNYDINNLSSIFQYILNTKSKEEIISIIDMNEHLYNRLTDIAKSTYLISDISNKMVSKNITKTRVSRLIINIILNNTQTELNHFSNNPYPFLRVLGFNSKKSHLLKDIEQNSNTKLITNLKNASKLLSTEELIFLEKDIAKTSYFLLSNSNKSMPIDAMKFENKLIIN